MNSPFIKLGNVKIKIDDLPEDAWEYIVGEDGSTPDLRKYFKSVAWLNRGVHLRKNHVSAMPFKIFKGETIIDQSDDYQNKLGFLPNLKSTLGMIEQGLVMNGREYQFIERSAVLGRSVATGFRHMVASSIKPRITRDGLQSFIRTVNGKPETLPVEQVLYFWYPDDNVELGEPQDWPALAALLAAGVLYAMQYFVKDFFGKGAIKVTLLVTKSMVMEAERARLKSWWDRLRGKAWSTEIVNADQVEVLPVGEGLESLDNTELSTEQREDIATALGIPHSMLFSNAANYATSVQDKQNFYEDTIIPEFNFIADTINEQVLEPLGYRLAGDPKTMDIFQEDEEQRSQAFVHYVSAGVRPSIVGEMLGLELPNGVEYKDLDEGYDQKQEMAEKLAEAPLQPARGQVPPDNNRPRSQGQPKEDSRALDLDKWERKALKRIQRGYDPFCSFDSEHIPLPIIAAIEGALQATTNNPALVRDVFASAWIGYP